jgi:hypothetical protein
MAKVSKLGHCLSVRTLLGLPYSQKLLCDENNPTRSNAAPYEAKNVMMFSSKKKIF